MWFARKTLKSEICNIKWYLLVSNADKMTATPALTDVEKCTHSYLKVSGKLFTCIRVNEQITNFKLAEKVYT